MLYDANGNEIVPKKEVTQVTGMVVSAQFRSDARSLVLQIRDQVTNRLSVPIQVSASAFPFGDNDAAMHELAKQLVRDRKVPMTLEFNPNDDTGDVNGYIAP